MPIMSFEHIIGTVIITLIIGIITIITIDTGVTVTGITGSGGADGIRRAAITNTPPGEPRRYMWIWRSALPLFVQPSAAE